MKNYFYAIVAVSFWAVLAVSCQKEESSIRPQVQTEKSAASDDYPTWMEPLVQLNGKHFSRSTYDILRSYGISSYSPENIPIGIPAGDGGFRLAYAINRHINKGLPIEVSVRHDDGTIHDVVVVGRGKIADDIFYYTYVDPAASNVTDGCNWEENRLVFNPSDRPGAPFFCDTNTIIGSRYDVVAVTTNDGLFTPGGM